MKNCRIYTLREEFQLWLCKGSCGTEKTCPHVSIICSMYVHASCHRMYIDCGYVYNTAIHYNDVIMSLMASQITSLTRFYSTVYSGANQRKHQSSASPPLCGEFTGDRWIPPQNVSNAEMLPFDDVIIPTHMLFQWTVRFYCPNGLRHCHLATVLTVVAAMLTVWWTLK